MELVWPVRRSFWDGLAMIKYRSSKPLQIPVPQPGEPALRPVPLADRVPSVPISNILVADRIPPDENTAKTLRFFGLQVALYRRFGPMQPGLPPVDADPEKALAHAYAGRRRRLFPPPRLPAEYERPDLGQIAVRSPYACYVQKAEDGSFEWDLRHLGAYETHDGLVGLGVHVRFELDPSTRTLRPIEIDSDLGRCRPGDTAWERAQRLALCRGHDLRLLDPPLQLGPPVRGRHLRHGHPQPPARRPPGAAPGVAPHVPHPAQQPHHDPGAAGARR